MNLTLTIQNPDEGMTPAFSLESDVAVIGRSRNCDWILPDATNQISSRHAELRRSGSNFVVKDISTNGTFLNGSADRLTGEHVIQSGDRLKIGRYDVVAEFKAAAPKAPPPPPPPPPPAPDPDRTVVQAAPAAAPEPAAEAAAADQPPEHVTVMWDSLADINQVDWSRGGLGGDTGAAAAASAGEGDLIGALLASAALNEGDVARSLDVITKAGSLLKRLVSGLVVMVEARARAKAQMGAEATGLQLDGNNPIKFARSPEQALARLLSPPESGFMDSDRAVEDAFLDLQSHQVATLRAIPGALRATLDRFSPGAIRRRAESGGILARIMPSFQDAALWRNYEREYVKVKNESDEHFMEVFSREFRKAYEKQLREGFDKGKK